VVRISSFQSSCCGIFLIFRLSPSPTVRFRSAEMCVSFLALLSVGRRSKQSCCRLRRRHFRVLANITDRILPPYSYSVVENTNEVEDCLAVGQKLPDGDERHVLFVKPKSSPLTPAIKDTIKSAIRTHLSICHVPVVILEVPKVSSTGNGKSLEVSRCFLPSALFFPQIASPHFSLSPLLVLPSSATFSCCCYRSLSRSSSTVLSLNHSTSPQLKTQRSFISSPTTPSFHWLQEQSGK
jgi:hypothetical protein